MASVVPLLLAAVLSAPAFVPLFAFTDPRIDESSGLVDLGDLVVTVNDSGDDAVVYVVDPETGDTVGTTRFADAVVDVEALAPAGDGEVWVGDIGDNAGQRADVTVYRVPVGRGDRVVDAPAYTLVYPDRPQDAETLLADPTGRLHIVTKSLFGGTVYALPPRLREGRTHRLRAVTRVGGFLTDGTVTPDGRHVILRDYGRAMAYAYPSWERLGPIPLPAQQQGEAIAMGPDGRVLVSTEGAFSTVHEVPLPAGLLPEPEPEPEPAPDPEPTSTRPPDPAPDADPERSPVLVGGGLVVLTLTLLVVTARCSRPRRRAQKEHGAAADGLGD